MFCLSSNYRIPHEGGFVYPLLHKFFLYEFCRTAANRLHTLSLISIKTITRLEGATPWPSFSALLTCRILAVRVPPPARPPAPPGGPARLPRARPSRGCARGFCGVLGRVRPLPASRLPAALCRSASPRWRRGPLWPSGASARVPARRAGSAPLRFVPRSAGLGLSARGLARRSGPPSPPPPRLRRPPFPLVWGGGRGSPRPRGSFALPSARAASCCRPCFAPGAARPPARLRLWRGPPFRPAPAGRLRPRSSAPGGRRRPCGAASWPLRGPPAL